MNERLDRMNKKEKPSSPLIDKAERDAAWMGG
jgi:hypothetical protein